MSKNKMNEAVIKYCGHSYGNLWASANQVAEIVAKGLSEKKKVRLVVEDSETRINYSKVLEALRACCKPQLDGNTVVSEEILAGRALLKELGEL